MTDETIARIVKVSNDIPRYKALDLVGKLTDRGDVMKAVPMVVVDTMQEAADMIEFFLGQMQLTDCKMDSNHGWRFRHGWPMTHCIGATPEEAAKAAIREIERSRSESA